MNEPRHRLLRRQLRRHPLTENVTLEPALQTLLGEVDRAYHQSDDDRRLLERSLELVSDELVQRNEEVVLALESATAATFRYSEASDEMVWEGYPLPFQPGARGRLGGPAARLFEPIVEADRPLVAASLREALASGAPFTLRFRVRGTGGGERWLQARGQVRRQGVVSGICLDITAEVEAGEAEQRRIADLARQGRVLVQMARSMVGAGDDPRRYVRQLTESLATTLGLGRASVWLVADHGQKLRCYDLYEPRYGVGAEDSHTEGTELSRADYPAYFTALEEQRLVAADDAHHHPATAEFGQSYLTPQGISSLLDASIRVGGTLEGVLCCEHVGPARAWTLEEQAFAASMADLVAQVLESARRASAEAALARQERFLRSIVDLDPNFIFIKDRQGRFVFVNQATAELYGSTVQGLLGKTDADFNPVEVEVANFRRQDLEVLDTGRELPIPESFVTDSTGRRLLLQTVKRPIFDESGRATLVLGVSTDVTARKQAEEARAELQQKLRQAQKLEAIGLLAGGVAHDFNNLLTPILLSAENLHERVLGQGRAQSEVEDVLAAAHAARDLTGQLLAFSRKQVLEMAVLDVNEELRRATRLLGRLMPETLSLDTLLHPRPCYVRADPAQLQQVLVNLIINARDAMPRGGHVVLRTRWLDTPDDEGVVHPEVLISVTDTGVGMDEATLSQVFEPFFTTKELGRGTGLGLSTAYGIVQQHKGNIVVRSTLGHGTTFEIRLPRVEAPVKLANEPKEQLELIAQSPQSAQNELDEKNQQNSETADNACRAEGVPAATILVVEDEPAVRRIVREILCASGFEALAAEDGEAAQRLCAARSGDIALLLTDVMLPGMNGRTLFETLTVQRPTMRVLYMSGYTQDVLGAQGVLEPSMSMLRKPFSPSELLGKVREVLAQGASPDTTASATAR